MNFAIIYTVIILLLGIPFFITNFARIIPIGVKIFLFVAAISLLWLHTIFFRLKGRTGVIAIILLIIFYFLIYIIILPMGAGSAVLSILDREKNIPAETIGSDDSTEQIYIVYHPGMSEFTTKVLRVLAEDIAQNNYKVILYSAGKDLQINLQDARAIGFASPVYAGFIRPPLEDFIQRNELSGIECFVILTGGGKESIDVDTAKAAKLIEEKDGKIIGKEKFITSDKENELQEKIKLFSKELIEKL
ncbi:hypothetical protein A2V47_04345 [Candidatus Atribacteria bacterium RBG_19FT_COMBO_35_14]|uniref:Flavodoxin-like domain-containing protein n=1 Tax=Candidatus Sediminicultor quintus TaxID=1797291 RepID=A0A1F5A677_9BACT|nr:MAG: hypothetical protein A2V47_04345 [Candidatus Atribacteria bacterium RBG_19FT_COMBO_35_14]OGD36327.1 MAG: hypothetical protein A2V94_05930 [Candidatus Atribacteria bacterium RBG_16_35_8]